MKPETLMEAARTARERAYAPYSGYTVGAALLTADGRLFSGCNVEFSVFSPTSCAERTALCAAVAAGCREFSGLAVSGGWTGEDPDTPCSPCGVCRQALSEFCGDDFPVYLEGENGMLSTTLGELLPMTFRFKKS
ncbi:MAG: cytidine deaminase [Christensenellales bacterium]|jgi:cytidine deaminase